jgi:hypothetical protein
MNSVLEFVLLIFFLYFTCNAFEPCAQYFNFLCVFLNGLLFFNMLSVFVDRIYDVVLTPLEIKPVYVSTS